MKSIKLPALLMAAIFFLIGLITLPDYGINWDTINHLPRGQAYLHYFLTGKKDYSDLNKFVLYYQNPDSLSIDTDVEGNNILRRSIYQSDATTFNWFVENEGGGHPPLSDILASMFNLILFQKLGIVNDIDSYRVYGIFLGSLVVYLVYLWIGKSYGKVGGFFAGLSLFLYPLFWSESHFNIEKDIPETVFITFMLYLFWQGVTKRKGGSIIAAGIFFGLALGTKFNVLFSLGTLALWSLIYFISLYVGKGNPLKHFWIENKKIILTSIIFGLIGLTIFVLSWPYLWGDLLTNGFEVIKFYKTIGTTQNFDPRYLGPLGINLYPIKWIVSTTPIPILLLSLVGFVNSLTRIGKEKDKVSLLTLMIFVMPIIRVTWPGTTVYGGVRQIMEYIPGMAMLSGIGAWAIVSWFRNKNTKIGITLGMLVAFIFLAINLAKIHPNENVYFNSIAGGLRGAKESDIPSWGNTFGAAYRQGVAWIDKNSEKGSKVVLVYELLPNIPTLFFRSDIDFQNSYRSGYLMRGEYAIALVYQGIEKRSYYDMFLEKFMEPVYESRVDGISVLKVWKNDSKNLIKPIEEKILTSVKMSKNAEGLTFDLGEPNKISRLELNYTESGCSPLNFGYVRISEDGIQWEDLPGILPNSWKVSALGEQPKNGHFIEPFVGQKARYIEIIADPIDTCLKNVKNYTLYTLL